MFSNSFINDFSRQYCYGNSIPILENPIPFHYQVYGLAPHIDASVNYHICNQLKKFEQTLQLNHATTIQLINVDGLSNHLNDIDIIIKKQKSKAKKQKALEKTFQKIRKEDPFLQTKLSIDSHLITKVFGSHSYKYQLKLSQTFDRTIYKERNFSLSVKLVDYKGSTVVNSNRIPITFNAYYNQQSPQLIECTRNKIPIFKGNNESEIYQGLGILSKLQFKEVSSFYSPKGIFFVMYAKPQSLKYNNNTFNYNERNIDYHYVRPLVIRDVIVKAKKK